MANQKPLITDGDLIQRLSDADQLNVGFILPNEIGEPNQALRAGPSNEALWSDANDVPKGGSVGDVLTRTGSTYDWAPPSGGTLNYLLSSAFLAPEGSHVGLALATNGCLYGAPFTGSYVIKIDPTIEKAISIGSSVSGTVRYWGVVLAEDTGAIYGIPQDRTDVVKIVPSTDTVSFIGSLGAGNKWRGGAYSGGYIVAAPYDSTTVLRIATATDTITTFGSISGSAKYAGAVAAPNGYVYCIPSSASTVLKINPAGSSTSTIGSGLGGNWFGGVLYGDVIYGIPGTATTILKIDTSTDTVTTFGTIFSGTNKWYMGVLGADNKIYGIPYSSNLILRIDPTDDTISYIPMPLYSIYTGGFLGGCLDAKGNIYSGTGTTGYLLKIFR